MKEQIATINASENQGSLLKNATSRNLFGLATSLSASVFLLASSAQANTASIAVIRDVETLLDVQREQCLIENELARRHNELSFTRKENVFTVALR